MTTTAPRETLGFQAEVKQLLHLMVHSLYGNKEIFLRELVSNASDAGDKLRFEALADLRCSRRSRSEDSRGLRQDRADDHGVGQRHRHVAAGVIEQIGTIAKSGTREFFQNSPPIKRRMRI